MEGRTIEQESWTISEIKPTLVYIYEEFMQSMKQFVAGINKLENPSLTKRRFIASLSVYYSTCAPYFKPYIAKRKVGLTAQDYDNLALKGDTYPPEVIYNMAQVLNDWNFQQGFFKIYMNKAQYATPIEEALAEIFHGEKSTYSSVQYNSLTPLYQFMESLVNDPEYGLDKTNDDVAYVIAGDTGSGKSNLQLLLFEHHYNEIIKVPDFSTDYLRYFPNTDDLWVKAIAEAKDKPLYNIAHDEAITILYRKDAMTTKNKMANILFNTIRGKKLVHSLLIPKFYRMDAEFVEDRMKFLLYVYKQSGNHYVAVYSYARMTKMLSEVKVLMTRKGFDAKTLSMSNINTPPNFTCRIPLYSGDLLNAYKERKERGMNRMIDDAVEKVGGSDKVAIGRKVYELVTKGGKTYNEAAKEAGVAKNTAMKYKKNYEKMREAAQKLGIKP